MTPFSGTARSSLGEGFFQEIIHYSIPAGHEHPESRSSGPPLGLDLYMWLAYRTFTLKKVTAIRWRRPLPPVRGRTPRRRANDRYVVRDFRKDSLRELKKIKDAWPESAIWDGPRRAHCLALEAAAPARRPVDCCTLSSTTAQDFCTLKHPHKSPLKHPHNGSNLPLKHPHTL